MLEKFQNKGSFLILIVLDVSCGILKTILHHKVNVTFIDKRDINGRTTYF